MLNVEIKIKNNWADFGQPAEMVDYVIEMLQNEQVVEGKMIRLKSLFFEKKFFKKFVKLENKEFFAPYQSHYN